MKKLLNFIPLFFLIACGGGGGGGGGGAAPVTGGSDDTTPPPSWFSSVSSAEADVYRTAEYDNQWGLEAIHAAEAYAILEKNDKTNFGDGVTIGITDSGIQMNHPEFAGSIDNLNTYNFGWVYEPSASESVRDTEGHGTHVAGIAAANKDDSGIQGVASDATILGVRMIGATPPDGSYGIAYGVNHGATVLNASWGFVNFDHTGVQLDIGSPTYDAYKAALSFDLDALKTGDAVLAAAAGNDAYTDYIGVPALFAQDDDYKGYIIVVGSVDDNSEFSYFSDHCKQAKDYCLVAPGEDIHSSFPNSTYENLSGTSMATPHVTGAAAVIRAAWPFLTAPQTIQILLTSATDLGAPGVDDVYGHGMLNLYEAVQAQGQNLLSFGSSVSSGGYDVRSSSMVTSPIFGDAFASNVAPQLQNAVFFDDFGRDYKASLDKKISSYKPTHQTDLSYLMNNNIASRVLPLRFGQDGKTNMRFNLSSYKNSEAQNVMGLKHLVMDRSIDPQQITNQNNGFSFVQNDVMLPNSSVGFAFNFDEISASQQKDFGASGFILKNNFAAGPYQDFMRQGSVNLWQNSRKFNQLFLDQNFFNQKFALKFSYQSSYESPQVAVNGTKQNQIVDFGMSFKAKNDLSFLFSGGNLTEFNNNMLNSRSVGAFGSNGDVKTSYVKFTAAKKFFKNFQLIASFSEGVSKINGNQIGIFRSFDNVRSRSTSIALVHNNFLNGELGMSYLEPLRVYRGSVNFDVAIARDNAGNLTRYQGSASLAPNGKEQDFEIFYMRNLNNLSSVKMNFLVQKEMANIKNFPTNYLGFVSYSKRF